MELNPSDFRRIIRPLEIQFKELDAEKFDLYYDRLKGSYSLALEYAVNFLLDSYQMNIFPKIHDIKEAMDGWWKDRGEATMEELQPAAECPVCRNMGFDVREEMSAEFPRGHNVAYFCRCELGRRMIEAHRKKDQELKKPKDIWKKRTRSDLDD